MGQAPASLRLEWAGPEAEVRAALRARATAALPAERDAAGGLKRTVLRCLLERSLVQRSDGGFELQPVVTAPLGEAVSRALAAAPDGQRALYKKAGYTLEQLLTSLQSGGIINITSVCMTKYAAVQQDWLQQQGGVPAVGSAASTSAAAGAAPGPAAAAVGAPVPNPVPAVAAEPAALVQPAQSAAMLVELDLCDFPVIMGGSLTASPAEIAFRFTMSIYKCIPGKGKSAASQVKIFALGTLLRLGIVKINGSSRFRVAAVPVAHAAQRLEDGLRNKGPAALQHYQQEYGGSLLAVLSDPACSPYVRLRVVDGQQLALLLLDRLAGGPGTAALPAAPPPSALPLPIPLPVPLPQPQSQLPQQQQHVSTSAAAAAAEAVANGIAALRLSSASTSAAAAASTAAATGAGAATGAAATSAVLPTAQLVTTAAAAEAAVAELLGAAEVAVDCEGDLERDGAVALVQLYAGGERCYVFDLVGMEAEEVPAAVGHLARLLESETTAKVMHDCRSDCEALFYQHGIRAAALWDTQVAFGLLQFLLSLSGEADGVNAPIGMNQLLQQYGLPLNQLKKAMHRRMDTEPQLFTARPLDAQALEYAVADVWQLLRAKQALEGDLGPAAATQVEALSAAYSEWGLEPGDRRNAAVPGGSGGYAGAVRLPLGKTMQLSFEEEQGYRPRFSPALEAGADASGCGEGEAGAARQPAELRAADDPDTQLILQLFPQHVAAEIMAALADAEEEAALVAVAAEAQEGQGGSEAGAGGSTPSRRGSGTQLVEVIVDRGRPVRVRLSSRRDLQLDVPFSIEEAVEHLAAAKGHLLEGGSGGELFYSDNRAGIPGTLHRISAMRDRMGGIVGLTYRVGRSVPGVGRLILDILHALSEGHDASGHEVQGAVSPSLLLLGAPGTGKTTLLRDVALLLSDTFHRNVVVVDTSNEVAGDASVPHPCISSARRMMVGDKRKQHDTMVEATANHNPDVVIIDEIGTSKEVAAAKSIAHRGVVLVGTAHGRTLEALMRNGELNGLVGGITTVTLGDAEAKQTNGGTKTRKVRAGDPAFSTLVEVESRNRWRVHMRVARSVDDILAGRQPTTQLRWVEPDGRIMVRLEGQPAGKAEGGGMRAAVAEAAGRLGKDGRWFQSLLELAAQS